MMANQKFMVRATVREEIIAHLKNTRGLSRISALRWLRDNASALRAANLADTRLSALLQRYLRMDVFDQDRARP